MPLTFGAYQLRPEHAPVSFTAKTDVNLVVRPKAFDLLQTLVDNRTRAVSKAELHQRLWPGTFVTEANLAGLVTELRRALGDEPRVPRFIRTVNRFGYAFCAQIASGSEPPPAKSTRSCWLVWSLGEILLHDGENIVGRDPAGAARLDFPSVSRQHACVTVSTDGIRVEDLGSKNGTFLRNERINGAMVLADRDELRVGSVQLTVRILSGGDRTETVGDR